ncbi:MAG: prepilin peptidase [Planctomycetota bacterium]
MSGADYPWHLSLMVNWVPVLFAFAFGACVGSLINVLVYRLPLGLPVVLPSSRCPNCETKLTWRENIPIFGWVLLGGRCRFCRSRISAEYPIVELIVALLFAVTYLICYLPHSVTAGVDLSWLASVQPEWAKNGFTRTWPTFSALLILIGSLVAMTMVDFRTFTIPLVLTWVPVLVAVVLHPVNALIVDPGLRYSAGSLGGWVIAGPGEGGWWWLGASIGGVVGIGIALALVSLRLIGRSFADYDEWEAEALAKHRAEHPDADEPQSDTPELWVRYPHARREMIRELAFLAAPVGLAWGGGELAKHLGGGSPMPLVLQALAAVGMGYLIGAAVVWGVRIFGSLAFGKEAMGLGDVHVLAAIGACMGWPDAVMSFFAAVVVGLFSAIVGAIRGGATARMLAFGPCLAIGALLVLYGKPLFELAITALIRSSEPINLP